MRNPNGFTLIEVMVAMVILVVGLLGLLSMSMYTMRIASENDQWTVARILAQGQIELISGENHALLMTWPNHETSVEKHESVNYTIDQWLTPLGTNTDPLEITVRVSYPGFSYGVSVTTIKTFFM